MPRCLLGRAGLAARRERVGSRRHPGCADLSPPGGAPFFAVPTDPVEEGAFEADVVAETF